MKLFFTLLRSLFFSTVLSSQNLNISEGSVFEGEPYLKVNPGNKNHIVLA